MCAVAADEAADSYRPRDDVSVGHFVEQLEGEGGVAASRVHVHVEEVVVEEKGIGEDGALEEVAMESGAEAEVDGASAPAEESGVAELGAGFFVLVFFGGLCRVRGEVEA